MKRLLKKNKGITLIALVITIIVLLILAGVTINAIIGNESAMEKAKKAKEENEISAAKDEAVLLATKYIQEYYDKRYVQNLPVATTSALPERNIEVGKDGNSTYKISGIELIKSLTGETVPSTIGEYVANKFRTDATNEGTYKYEAGTYEAETGSKLTVKNKQTDETIVTGTIKEDGTIEWDASPSEGSGTTTITVGGEEITLTPENAKDYYGTTVKIIDGIEYGLFYIDFTGKYGDAGAVYLRAKSYIRFTSVNEILADADKSTAIGIMKKLNPDWARADARGNLEYTDFTRAEKEAAYLCNPNDSMWIGIGSSFDSSDLNYVIGAPSVEMFLDSYNAKYPNSSPKYTTAFRSAGQNYTYPGYLYSINNGRSYSSRYNSAIQQTAGGMYRNTRASEWLASPLSSDMYDDYMCIVTYDGNLDSERSFNIAGVAPLVSLKSGIHLVATGSKITVDGTDIDLGQLNATTVAQYYGRTVKEIDGVEYGLFYVDYAGKYGDAGTVYLRAKSSIGDAVLNEYTLPSEGSGSSSSSSSSSDPRIDPPYDAIEIMKQINPDWARNRGNNLDASEYLASERGAAYLCDEDNWRWSGIGNSFDSNYLNYVIGAPSVEMFLDSYNAKYPNSSPKYTTAYRTDNGYPGYLYSNDGGNNYSNCYLHAIQEGDSSVGGMYRNSNSNEWLASPLSDDYGGDVFRVYNDGSLSNYYWANYGGVAPLVSLKSGVDLTE